MSLNFYRRVAFGLSPQDERPQEPLSWALNQLKSVPDFLWKGSIPTEKELRKKYGEWVYGDREVLRKKYKNDKNDIFVDLPYETFSILGSVGEDKVFYRIDNNNPDIGKQRKWVIHIQFVGFLRRQK